MSGSTKLTPSSIARKRRRRTRRCADHLIAAPLWVAYTANLGTLLRTCDAVGACLAVPATPHYRQALARGDTLVERDCIHDVTPGQIAWVETQRTRGARIVAVELAEDATPLPRVTPARETTIVLLGHERLGIPLEV